MMFEQSEELMDATIGKTNIIISKTVKGPNILTPSLMCKKLNFERFNGSGGALSTAGIFSLTGQTDTFITIPSNGLYQIMATMYAGSAMTTVKPVHIYHNGKLIVFGHACYNYSSTHVIFLDLVQNDTISFGAQRIVESKVVYPTYLILNRWLIRKVCDSYT